MRHSDAGKPSEAVHTSFSGYVAREMGKAEALLKVVGSRPENLVDNFFTLMPSGSPADFQRILELKASRLEMLMACLKRLAGNTERVLDTWGTTVNLCASLVVQGQHQPAYCVFLTLRGSLDSVESACAGDAAE